MARYTMLIMSAPTAGREADYNDWYQQVHLPEMVALPGIVSARRFRRAAALRAGVADFPYIALYEIECDDIDTVLQGITAAAREGRLHMSDAIDTDGVSAVVYAPCGEPVSRLDLSAAGPSGENTTDE